MVTMSITVLKLLFFHASKPSIANLTLRPSLYFDSKTDIAAREPEPIVANGKVSVDPWGYICKISHFIGKISKNCTSQKNNSHTNAS
jgi:hypothetical protein